MSENSSPPNKPSTPSIPSESYEELQTLIKCKIINQKANWKKLLTQLKTCTPQQLIELKDTLNEMEETVNRSEISTAIENILSKRSNKDTFALPAHGLMFTLLAMFAGKTKFIPRCVLTKSHSERTLEERKEADKYIKSIFHKELSTDYSEGFEQINENVFALICDNPKVEAKAQINDSLFREDLTFREGQLAIYIRRTYGPEGLRHFLGLILGLEENYRQGHFEWSVNDHLERLGYRKKANGAFDPQLKRTASEIIKIFTQLCITSIRKNGKKQSINGEFLFVISGFNLELFEREIINQKIKLNATDFWYKNAFDAKDGKAPKYTKLLRKIVRENHRENPLTLYLAPLLAIFWRMQPEQKIKIKNIMEWCDLESTGRYKLRNLKSLNASLNYMKEKGYLGNWIHNGDHQNLTENEDPFSLTLILTPPDWLQSEMTLIQEKRETFSIEKKPSPSITSEEFLEILEQSGLTNTQFAQHLGVSGQYVSLLKRGKRKISATIAKKLASFSKKQTKNDAS